nr:MAG TPA: DNA directed DNA polymerase [Caudoviricetes sp.]
MIKLQDTIIQTDTQSVLDMLKFDLAQHGVDRFHIFRNNGENIQTNCPFHKNGQERKPSFGVNGEIDKCHCFSCGWAGTIEEMISELYGYQDEGKFGKRWLIKRFNTVEIETRPNIMEGFNGRNNITIRNNNDIHRFKQPIQGDKSSEQYSGEITEEELDKYRYIHPYLYQRGLTDEIIERFDIGYDRERKEITFPVRDIEGRCVFIAGRSTERKFFRLPKGLDKPVYQAYRFQYGEYKEAYITESFLNCLTCWKYDKPAMAMIGTGNQKQYEILNKLPVREYILAFDPDEAGRKATERFRKNVHGKIIKELVYTDNRDINDLQKEFLNCKIIF